MNHVVVDTDVVSFLFKSDTRAKAYSRHLAHKQIVLSFMTLAELYLWSRRRDWGPKRVARLDKYIAKCIVHPFDPVLCRVWAEISHRAQIGGRRIEVADAWIAATALLHKLPLATHNPAHFQHIDGLTIISEHKSRK